MRISLKEIGAASKCFRYNAFLKESKWTTAPKYNDIALGVIKRCYIRAMETGFRAEWRSLVGWVDTEVFRDIDTSNEEQFDEARKLSEKTLNFLRVWYYQVYLAENNTVYVDVPIKQQTGKNLVFGTAPIVKLGKHPSIMIISNIAATVGQLYNDISIRGMQWMLSEALECDTVAVEHLYIGTQGKLDKTMMYAGSKDHHRAKSAITQVASLVSMGADWPSVTDMCNSCPFKRRCKL